VGTDVSWRQRLVGQSDFVTKGNGQHAQKQYAHYIQGELGIFHPQELRRAAPIAAE
jgi:hypothetical protein